MTDWMMPNSQPAQAIYKAFEKESRKRPNYDDHSWIEAERDAVLKASHEIAEKMGLKKPTLEEIKKAENFASGHSDYGKKWAYGVADYMLRKD